MPKVEINGAAIWYQRLGSGPNLVQIGGAVSGHEGYATVTDAMAQHFTVLDYDHRGYGLSDRPDQRYSLDVWSKDLVGLLDHLEIERTHVHGGSMGGFIAVYFATLYPERVDRLVIGGAVAKCDTMARHQFRGWKDIANAYGLHSLELASLLSTYAFSRRYLDGPDGGPVAVAAMREVTERNASLHVFLDACDAMMTADVTADLGKIVSPTLVMVGEEDVLTPLDCGPDGAGARAMADSIRGAQLAVLQGGHGYLVEQPVESINLIVDFLLG
ncbi:MAG: alpha/beta fold hydrolase [Acidimicrobiia bacterium]